MNFCDLYSPPFACCREVRAWMHAWLTSLTAFIAGSDGAFEFDALGKGASQPALLAFHAFPGRVEDPSDCTPSLCRAAYDSTVPVFALRLLPAVCGAALAPLLCHVRACLAIVSVLPFPQRLPLPRCSQDSQLLGSLGFSSKAGLLAGLLVLCDTALLTQSRLVLLDTPMLACMLGAVACYAAARRCVRCVSVGC
jgi:hypothetical protein